MQTSMRWMLATLEFLDFSTARRNVVMYVGDGGGTCNGQNERIHLERTVRETAATHPTCNASALQNKNRITRALAVPFPVLTTQCGKSLR